MVSRPGLSLTTTSYALLGLLAIKPWTTYELARQMDRSLGRLWPRATSKVYEEPKKLAALGLVQATREATGRRGRTVYTITEDGRRALRCWLETPGGGPVLEFEQLMQVFFAENASRDDALRTIEATRAWAREQCSQHIAVARSYLTGAGPFQQRAAMLALTGRFLVDFTDMVGRWADWAHGVVSSWPEDPRLAEPNWTTFAEVAGREADWAAPGPPRTSARARASRTQPSASARSAPVPGAGPPADQRKSRR